MMVSSVFPLEGERSEEKVVVAVRSVVPTIVSVRIADRFGQRGLAAVARSSHVLVTAPLGVGGSSVQVRIVGWDGVPTGQPVGNKGGDDLEIGRSFVLIFNIIGGCVIQLARDMEIC